MINWNATAASRHYEKEWLNLAAIFRASALDVLNNRDVILGYLDAPGFERIYADRNSTCFERATMYEALSYGDPSVLLSCPGPSLSGIVVRELGSEAQQEYFFNHVSNTRARTCMAVTEPGKGSDAGNPSSLLNPEQELCAEKWLVGNGREATMGTMVIRTGPGPFSIAVILLTPEILNHVRASRQLLPVSGLQGAGLSHLYFDRVPVEEQAILGLNKRPLERGMHAVIKTFYRMRPCVSAMALGSAQALLDAALPYLNRHDKKELHQTLQTKLDAARRLNHQAAMCIDDQIMDGSAVSLAKACATEIAEKVAVMLPLLVGTSSFLTDVWLQKIVSDIQGYEWMEGSIDMQRLNIIHSRIQSDKNH